LWFMREISGTAVAEEAGAQKITEGVVPKDTMMVSPAIPVRSCRFGTRTRVARCAERSRESPNDWPRKEVISSLPQRLERATIVSQYVRADPVVSNTMVNRVCLYLIVRTGAKGSQIPS